MFEVKTLMPVVHSPFTIEEMQNAEAKYEEENAKPYSENSISQRLHRFRQFISARLGFIWWLRNIFFTPENRGNRVRIQTLSPGWADPDTRLLHSSFQILVDYVELEKPFKHIEWSHSKEHSEARDEILDLYHWWKFDGFAQDENGPEEFWRINENKFEMLKYADAIYGKNNWLSKAIEKNDSTRFAHLQWVAVESAARKKQDKNLIRLIKIRHFLWT